MRLHGSGYETPHILEYCIINLTSCETVVAALKKQYPNLQMIRVPTPIWDDIMREKRAKGYTANDLFHIDGVHVHWIQR